MPAKKTIGQELLALLVHFPLATLGSMALSFVVMAPLSWVLRMLQFDVSYVGQLGPYTPAFWGVALLLGLLVNKFMSNRSACWVGGIGLVFLFAVMFWDISILKHSVTPDYWKYEFDQLFSLSSKKCGDSECLEQLLVTTPVLNSIAYSVGAWFGLRFGGEAR
jgi:hypothetical protein